MYFNFATLSLIAAAILSSVSAVSHLEDTPSAKDLGANSDALLDNASNNELDASSDALLAKRAFLSRRKVASALERRNRRCDHKNHITYQLGDEIRHHRPLNRHHCGTGLNAHCGDSDYDYDFYGHDDFDEFDGDDFDFDDDYFECDECDACFGDHRYMSWSDYEDEITK